MLAIVASRKLRNTPTEVISRTLDCRVMPITIAFTCKTYSYDADARHGGLATRWLLRRAAVGGVDGSSSSEGFIRWLAAASARCSAPWPSRCASEGVDAGGGARARPCAR